MHLIDLNIHFPLAIIVKTDDDWLMKYPGGKGKCYQHIVNLMPPHETYIESHLGGGSVMRHKHASRRSIGIDIDDRVIDRWRKDFPDRCELVNHDAAEFLRTFQFTGSELVYSDPPYVPATRRRAAIYRHEYKIEDHIELLKVLSALPCMVILSGYDSSLYHDYLVGWETKHFRTMTQSGMRTECLWFNFRPPAALHDARFIGENFRERQTIKRRQERLQTRIREMNPIERSELIRWINDQYGNTIGEMACNPATCS